MDGNKKRKTDPASAELIKKKKSELKEVTPHLTDNQEEVTNKKEVDANADQLKAMDEKNHRNAEKLSKLHLCITKQKMQIDELKTQWRTRQRNDKEMARCFEEVHELQSMLYEQLCDLNIQLNKARNWNKTLKQTFINSIEEKTLYSEKVNQLKKKIENLNKSKSILEQQIKKLKEEEEIFIETWNRKLQQEEKEICNIRKLILTNKENLKNETETEQKLREKLTNLTEMQKSLISEKEKACQEKKEAIQQLQQDLEAKLLEVEHSKSSLDKLTQKKRDIENEITRAINEIENMNRTLKNKNDEFQELEKKVSLLQIEIEKKEQELEILQKKISERDAEIEKTKADLAICLQKQSDDNETKVTLKKAIQSHNEEIEAETARLYKQKEVSQTYAEQIRILEEQLKNQERKKDDLMSVINTESEMETSKDDKLKKLLDDLKALELELEEVKKENKVATTDVKKVYSDKKRRNQLQREITTLKKKVDKNNAKIEELKTMKEILTTENKISSKKHSELEKSIKMIENENEKLKESLNNQKKENEAINQELKMCETEIQKPLDVNVFEFTKESSVDSPTHDLENMNFDFSIISSADLKKTHEDRDKVFSMIDNTIETLKNTNLSRSSSLKSKLPPNNDVPRSNTFGQLLSQTAKSQSQKSVAETLTPKLSTLKTLRPTKSSTKTTLTPNSSTTKALTPNSSTTKALTPKSSKLSSTPSKSAKSVVTEENKEPKSILTKKGNKFIKSSEKSVKFLSPIVSKSKKSLF